MDNDSERILLQKELEEKYPTLKRSKALLSLYKAVVEKIKSEQKQGKNTDELQNKMWLILDEWNIEINNKIVQRNPNL